MEITSFEVKGYQERKIPNTFISPSTSTQNLGILLPGYRFSVDREPLHLAGRILLEQDIDLLKVEYGYNETNINQQPERVQEKWLTTDIFAICNAALAHRPYQKITLVGKSLGTLVMGHLLQDDRFQNAACVWLTPLLAVKWLVKCIENVRPRSLFVIGTADSAYDPGVLNRLEKATMGRSIVIEDANHGLEIPGSVSKSLAALNQIVQAMQEFLV